MGSFMLLMPRRSLLVRWPCLSTVATKVSPADGKNMGKRILLTLKLVEENEENKR